MVKWGQSCGSLVSDFGMTKQLTNSGRINCLASFWFPFSSPKVCFSLPYGDMPIGFEHFDLGGASPPASSTPAVPPAAPPAPLRAANPPARCSPTRLRRPRAGRPIARALLNPHLGQSIFLGGELGIWQGQFFRGQATTNVSGE